MGTDKAGDPGDHDLCYVLTSSQIPEIPPGYTLQYARALLQDGPPPASGSHRPAEPRGYRGQKGRRVAVPTTLAHLAGTAPSSRDVGASDYPALKAGYSIGGKTGTTLHFPSRTKCCRTVRNVAGPPERRRVAPASILASGTGRTLSGNRRAEKSGWYVG